MDPRVSSNLFTRRNFLSIAAGFAATAAGLGLTACNNATSNPSTLLQKKRNQPIRAIPYRLSSMTVTAMSLRQSLTRLLRVLLP